MGDGCFGFLLELGFVVVMGCYCLCLVEGLVGLVGGGGSGFVVGYGFGFVCEVLVLLYWCVYVLG